MDCEAEESANEVSVIWDLGTVVERSEKMHRQARKSRPDAPRIGARVEVRGGRRCLVFYVEAFRSGRFVVVPVEGEEAALFLHRCQGMLRRNDAQSER